MGHLVYDASAGKLIATNVTSGSNNTYGVSKVFTVDPSNNTFTAGNSLVTFNNNSSTYFELWSKHTKINYCRNSSNNIITKVGTVSGSGSNATITYANSLDLGAGFYTDAAYIAHAQQIVFTYTDSGSGDYPHAHIQLFNQLVIFHKKISLDFLMCLYKWTDSKNSTCRCYWWCSNWIDYC